MKSASPLSPALLCSLLFAQAVAAAPEAVDFDRQVAPILVRRCLECHGGLKPRGGLDLSRKQAALAGGDSGAVIRPGKSDDSLLWQHVRDNKMPPKRPLPDGEKDVLRRWLEAGALWGTDPLDPLRHTTDRRAGLDWWALQPLSRPVPPAVRDAPRARNPIDRFLQERLEAQGLPHAPEAGRRTLIRRVTFDLIGLPPAPEEVAAFLVDTRPDAYERLVERLLASPHYGERWARHWLDVVRYGESNGFERDLPRPNAWHYRDWVMRALNRDLPYEEFVRLQLAGDVLRPGDPDALRATGFLVAGPHDTVVPVSERMKATMRQDEMEDLIGTVGQAFLGLTVNCARCHDHKFDPISQRDYYALAAALAGVEHGERDLPPGEQAGRLAGVQREINLLRDEQAGLEDAVRARVLAQRSDRPASRPAPPRPLAEWDFRTGLEDQRGELHASLAGSAKQDASGLVLDGRTGYAATPPLKADLAEKTLEAWVRLDNLKQRGGGVLSLQTPDGQVFDAIVFGERQPGHWVPGSDFFRRTRDLGGPQEKAAATEVVHVAISYAADGTITAYRNGQPHGKAYRAVGPVRFTAGKAQVVFGLRHAPAGGTKMLAGTIVRARVYDRALTAEEVARSAGAGDTVTAAAIQAALTRQERAAQQARQVQLAILLAARERLRQEFGGKVYAVTPIAPGETRLLVRGNVAEPGPVVKPGGVPALAGLSADFGLAAHAPEGERRARLARWLTDANNPLFARVIVNRVWHHHFGSGIVDTPSDLGFNGGRPSHPELLDWLAGEFVRQGYSLKALHRLIVTSAAYRQSSRVRREEQTVGTPGAHAPGSPSTTPHSADADNRLLWRYAPQRLEAEAVRDAMLAAAGVLDRTVGGRGYQDTRSYFFKGTQFYDPVEQVGPAFHRRTLYRMWARGGRSPLLDAFDCPDPSTATPRRARTTTPLQALALLNNAFVLDVSQRFAERLQREAGEDVEQQIGRAYELALGRPAAPEDVALIRPFVERHGLAAFCRVLFNSNEFLHVD